MKPNTDTLASDLWGAFFPEIPKGTFAAAAFYFADASKAEGQTAQERFFEVWTGMQALGSAAPTNSARRALKKFLAAQGKSKEEIKVILAAVAPFQPTAELQPEQAGEPESQQANVESAAEPEVAPAAGGESEAS